MAAIKSWLDRNSEKETHPPAITIPDQVDVPQGNTPGLEPDKSYFDRPWNNQATQIIIDAYEKNTIDWDKMAIDKRVVGVIHRSAIGLTKDARYEERKKIALDRGYLWGAYHLGKRGNTIEQANLFLEMAGSGDTLMALDLEDTSNASMMTVDEAVQFMQFIYDRTGKVPVVYANHAVTKALNEKLKSNNLFKASKLWYARFKPEVTDFPVGIWKGYFLWQFSSEINCSQNGTCLYNVPGTRFDMDVNVFFGSINQLKDQWNNKAEKVMATETAPQLPAKEKLWFEIAKVEIGQKEITGPKHNQKILAYHQATDLRGTTDEIPWCSSFVSWCLENAGIESTKSAWARSYLNWGKKIETPVPGCVTIFKRGTDSGHVAFFVKDNGSTLTVLGGNQSNQVCYSDYKKADLLGYRLPSEN